MHRVAQFVAHVRARVEPDEQAEARSLLTDAAWRLFAAMPVADRRHALDVVARLRHDWDADPDLFAAALLHDVAKGDRMRLWHRVAGVLLEAWAPRLLRRLASPDPGSWRHPFHLYLHHQQLSADLAEAAGCSSRTVAILRGDVPAHPSDARLAAALKAADDAS